MGRKIRAKPRIISLGLNNPPEWTEGLLLRESDLAPFWVGEDKMEPADASWFDYGYARPKGQKSLYRSTEFMAESGLDPNGQLVKFPQILAVDTNTRLIGGSRVSVSAVVAMRIDAAAGGYVRGGVAFLYAMEMWNTAADAEAIGWEFLVNLIRSERGVFRWPILILTDCDLARHESINQRKEPLRGELYLPPGTQLAYASADAGGELISTKLIRAADKLASSIMLEENLILNLQGLRAVYSPDYSHLRQWHSEDPVL